MHEFKLIDEMWDFFLTSFGSR